MPFSMTGYGSSQYENDLISLRVEIKSVNSKFLDIYMRLPKNILFAEEQIRNLIRKRIARGKVDCNVFVERISDEFQTISFDEKISDSYFDILKRIKKKYRLKSEITASQIALYQGVVSLKDDSSDNEKLEKSILEAFDSALESLIVSRQDEGNALMLDCISKVKEFEIYVSKTENISKDIPAKYKEKLEKRISELTVDVNVDQTRIAQEVAIFADRACIDEEITRLYSHVKQFSDTVTESESGKKLDFLLQEMLRETNTIASKANDLDITKNTLEMKYLLEKIREQVQNLE